MALKNILCVCIFILTMTIVSGCTDMGSPVAVPAVVPTITSLQPDSAFTGDTLRIFGTNFGATRGSSVVSIGGTIADTVYAWSSVEIDVKVPASAESGNVSVTVNGTASNGMPFEVRGTPAPTISFANDVFPIFQNSGCTGCHGGNGGLFLDSYAHLLRGNSNHGPVVTPGNGEGSVIIKKLRGTAGFGSRMPLNGPYLSDATIGKISLWITQGALNN
ncbi:MAG TPA: IPT/TIG domain-containing protein [Bacteroidota bacterium]|nr:IPT/TIG domain-containing protein [Bacteroidota bacterium]